MARNVTGLSVICAICLALCTATANADFKDDIGFTELESELGASTPDGTGVTVAHSEGRAVGGYGGLWLNTADADFDDMSITYVTGQSQVYWEHSTVTARNFFGNNTSIAPGVTDVLSYTSCGWLAVANVNCYWWPSGHANSLLKWPAVSANIGGGALPGYHEARVGNHSYVEKVGSGAVRRIDWYIATDDSLEFFAMNNGNPSYGMPVTFNSIVVSRSDGLGGTGAYASLDYLDSGDTLYVAGHARPHLVATSDADGVPNLANSNNTPVAASVGVLLVETGHADSGLSTDPNVQSFTNRAGLLIRNAERSEVIKAAMMAGAFRNGRYTSQDDPYPQVYLAPYRASGGTQTDNGLDTLLGAGQVNVRNSYYIIAAGEQNSYEDGGAGSSGAGDLGFDYDPHFGGSNSSNAEATYVLPTSETPRLLTAALVWNIKIVGDTEGNPGVFDGTTTLHDLKVSVVDNTVDPWVVASSDSSDENTENIWFELQANHDYLLVVNRGNGSSAFDWDYGLAWQALPDTDADGVPDEKDNCVNVANGPFYSVAGPSQLDVDNDGYGNICDGDMNNNGGNVNSQDYAILTSHLNNSGTNPYDIADLNGSGSVTGADQTIESALLGFPAGPSGLVP